ncbi:MAG: hypothetical protein ACREM3_12635 [Candidatus Rokuibacteriota bacterium]
MQDAKAQELFGQLTGKAVETIAVWTETNQRVLRELIDLSSGAAKEGLRLSSELSRNALDAMRESQTAVLRWQTAWMDTSRDPAAWYQMAVTEGINGAQQAFRRVEDNAQAVTRSAERLQTTTEQAGKSIQESVAGAVSKMKDVYAKV